VTSTFAPHDQQVAVPAPGQLVTVRHRQWVAADVSRGEVASSDPHVLTGRSPHLVTLASIEDDAWDDELQVIWELEPGTVVHDVAVLPSPEHGFDELSELAAFLHAVRWGAIASADTTALQAPFRSAAERGWWQAYGSALTDATQTQIALEEDATTITNFEPVVVPGLLQTAAYARAVISTAVLDVTPREVEARVGARMARQAVLTKPDPPQLITILDEAVLHREVGGRAVMARQLRQLIEAATTQPNVTVRVIPFTAGAHAASEGPFAIIEFGVEPGAVLLEGKTADLFLEEPNEIAGYQDTARTLLRSALGADDSIALIEQMLREMI
jgi:hypothetical protein